jgi:class 3 adenylate cyclase
MHRWSLGEDHIDPGRRHVAVMFADLTGFAGLVESIGAEVAVARAAPLMDRLVALVATHGGVVQRIVDGASMSVFGLRSETGDHAAQAIRAGVAFVSAAAEGGLPVHVGIEWGEVAVSRSWEPAGFAVWGDPVRAAKNLCDAAAPGTIAFGPRALDLAGHKDREVPSPGANTAGHTGHEYAEHGDSRRAEHRRPRVERPAANALTRAETAVARLVAEGLSNPQIAHRLYISRHTAETHMKHIFAKLGVSSRAELAARVASQRPRGVA